MRFGTDLEETLVELDVLPGRYAICRCDPQAALPPWAQPPDGDGLLSVTWTADELSVVCLQDFVPAQTQAERGWVALRVQGPLAFSFTGILASLVVPLRDAAVSVFVVSTYATDYLLIPAVVLAQALTALRAAGHTILQA
jgi:hypothetical protein